MSDITPFGLTLLVDKPLTWTSFDVVNKLRYTVKELTGKKKNKVGHAGTLDPLATGLLIICIGSHTKKIEGLQGLPKAYTGTIKLGATTPSYDLELPIDQTYPIPECDHNLMQKVANSFVGTIEQIPPAFSAKKIAGKKAYELARKGRNVDLNPSLIKISEFKITTENYPEINFEVKCSKGTYIRSLAHDFGIKLNTGAHLTSLRRTQIGLYSVTNAHTVELAIDHIREEYANYLKHK